MRRASVLSVLVVALVAVLAACNSATTATGKLNVTVTGLPSGVNAAVLVTMGSYSRTVAATTTLSGLAPGTYTVTPQTVTLRWNAFDGTTSSTSVTVSNGATASASVAYTVRPGDLWVVAHSANTVTEYSAASLSGTPTTGTTFTLTGATSAAFDASGNLWVGSSSGTVTEYLAASLSGTPTTGTQITGLNQPWGLAFDASGNLWVPDYTAGTVTEYMAASLAGTPVTGTVITLAGATSTAFDASGNLWVGTNAGTVTEYLAASLSGTPTTGTQITGLSALWGLTFDASGNLWVPDYGSGTVTEYLAASLAGTPTTGTTISASGPVTVAFDTSGNLWLADYTTGAVTEYLAASLSGTPTTGTQITGLNQPYGLAFDPPPYNLPLSH